MTEHKEVVVELTEEFYEELVIKTIDPKVELKDLCFHTIVRNNKGRFGILWIKDVFKKENKFYANAQVQVTVDTHEEAVIIMSGLKKELEAKGVQTKSQ